MDIDLKGL
jgi:hypothetical protein